MKIHLAVRVLATTATLALGLGLTACSTAQRQSLPTDNLPAIKRFGLADGLYLRAAPHARLYVEVDAVEGCEPSQPTLDRLQNFLRAYCNKPGGIEIARSDVIPLPAASGISPSALARKYINGPPDDSAAPPPAFIYVLFYDDALCDRAPVRGNSQTVADARARRRARNRNPHVEVGPYPAMIYLNTRPPIGFKWEWKWDLLHETGHVLGLAFRPNRAAAGHCQDYTCLMSGRGMYRYLPGLQRRLCQQCLAQVAEASRQTASTNLHFVGPVLVRSEGAYHVLTLPHRTRVIVGELAEKDCREFASAVRAETPESGEAESARRVDGTVKDGVGQNSAALADTLDHAKVEPDGQVRVVLSRACAQAAAGWYSAQGQYTNAVKAFQEALLRDPADDWAYNQLAWIKATCPDPLLRDGQWAVAAAAKACELAGWKEWSWIDTLPAAYAEAGDFNRAIALEEQALRTGTPAESDQQAMRERTRLYQQSQAFREKR